MDTFLLSWPDTNEGFRVSKPYDLTVFIGRMAPLHNAHVENINMALELGRHTLILFGSANAPRDEKNPFTNEQRQSMIDLVYPEVGFGTISTDEMYDQPSDDLWAAEVRFKANNLLTMLGITDDPKIAIVGHKKDESSFYLDLFPGWDFIETGAHMFGDDEMAATTIRKLMFEDKFEDALDMMDENVWDFIRSDFMLSREYGEIKAEYEFHQKYPQHRREKYPINDVTADAVVLCAGHVLLIRRKNIPGKGKLALPGGFVQTNETVMDGAVRELIEETRLHVPEKVIRGSIVDEMRFDSPGRSLRGRIMTFAFTIKIDLDNGGKLPRVYGSDDADKAFWVPLEQIAPAKMAAEFFEDHHKIIMTMIGRAAKQQQ